MLIRIKHLINSAMQTFKTNLLFSRTFLHELCVSKNWEMVKNINIILNKLLKSDKSEVTSLIWIEWILITVHNIKIAWLNHCEVIYTKIMLHRMNG